MWRVLLLVAVAGCHLHLLEQAPPLNDRAWQTQVTNVVNCLEKRVAALDGKGECSADHPAE